MRTVLRVVALLFLVAVGSDAYVLSRHNPPLLVACCATVAAAAVWRDAVAGPAAVVAGGLYLAALLVGHVPSDAGALFVGTALVAYVDISAWSAATPRHAAVPARALAHLVAHEVLALAVGAGMGWLVIAGRSQASRASLVPWLAGLATFSVALLLPSLRAGARGRR
jgi:hypothetical protein